MADQAELIEQAIKYLKEAAASLPPKLDSTATIASTSTSPAQHSIPALQGIRPASLSPGTFQHNFPALHGIRPGALNLRQTSFPSRRSTAVSKSARAKPYYRPLNSWTQRFYCLGRPTDISTADRNYNILLEEHHLGAKKIKFDDKEGTHEQFLEKLCEEYPPLRSQEGAIMLWRCSIGGNSNRPLDKLIPGPHGYSISYLRGKVQSGTIYITPMQSSLLADTELFAMGETATDKQAFAVCQICNISISLSRFTEHLMQCSKNMLAEDRADTQKSVAEDVSLKHLQNMFPRKSPSEIAGAYCKSTNLNEAAESLLFIDEIDNVELFPAFGPRKTTNEACCSKDINEDVTVGSLEELKDLLTKSMDSDQYHLQIEREEMWRGLLLFYKKALQDKTKLTKELIVRFSKATGEDDAIDAGALKREFFNEAFETLCERLFEGDSENGFVPKRLGSSGKAINYTVAGVLVGHAFSQASLMFSRLQGWVFKFLLDPTDIDLVKCLVNVNLVPLNQGTVVFHNLVKSLNNARTKEDIDHILDQAEFIEKVNSSQWGLTEQITIETKDSLIAELVYDELVRKRSEQLMSFKDGLEFCGIFSWFKQCPDICEEIICIYEKELVSQYLARELSTILSKMDESSNKEQHNALKWLIDYVEEKPNIKSEWVLCFITAWRSVPPWGLDKSIVVKFLPDDEEKLMPESNVCFNIVSLPVVHTNKVAYYKYLEMALEAERSGFAGEE